MFTGNINNQSKKMSVAVILMVTFLMAACAAPIAAPTLEPPTATPEPPTATPIPPMPTPRATHTPVPPDERRLDVGEITSEALAGNLLGDPETRKFITLLPPGYDYTDKRYPVVYVLHGYTGSEWSMVTDFHYSLKKFSKGDIQDMIFVFPDASNKFKGSWYLSSPTIGDYETYITQELVQLIDTKYRTISHRDSRGITGCSMGGDGSMHLALIYPDVFSVVAGVSGIYDYEHDPVWETARSMFKGAPSELSDFRTLRWQIQNYVAAAAAAAPNPEKPPFYLDMPFEVVGDEAQIVPDVMDKISAADPLHDVPEYLDQPVRLRGAMIYTGASDAYAPVETIRVFDQMLTDLGVEHEYLEVPGGHCNLSYEPVLQFMSDHLAFETAE